MSGIYHQKYRPVTFSYLVTFSTVAFTRYSLLPWLLIYIHSRKYEYWGQAVVSYGVLLSALNVGISLGHGLASYCQQLTNTFFVLVFFVLTSSYVGIAFVSRFIIMMLLFVLVGFCGTLLSGYSLTSDTTGAPSITFHRQPPELLDHPQQQLERLIVAFTFSTLIASILYDHRASVTFPVFYLALFLACGCCIVILYYMILTHTIAKRMKSSSGNGSGRGGGSYGGSGVKGGGGTRDQDKKGSTNGSGRQQGGEDDGGEIIPYTGDVPRNFFSMSKGDLAKARSLYAKMLAWRRRHAIDDCYTIPQPYFNEVLTYYPHAIHGYSLDGCGVVYECLGRGKPAELQATGISIDELAGHFTLRNEVVFREMCNLTALQKKLAEGVINEISPFAYRLADRHIPGVSDDVNIPKLMTVIDVKDINFFGINAHVLSFIQKSGELIDNYYPEQVKRLVVCNAPRWFSRFFSMIAQVLPEAVKNKVDILYDVEGLKKYIHPSQRPKEYGGTDDKKLGEHEMHRFFVGLQEQWQQRQQQDGQGPGGQGGQGGQGQGQGQGQQVNGSRGGGGGGQPGDSKSGGKGGVGGGGGSSSPRYSGQKKKSGGRRRHSSSKDHSHGGTGGGGHRSRSHSKDSTYSAASGNGEMTAATLTTTTTASPPGTATAAAIALAAAGQPAEGRGIGRGGIIHWLTNKLTTKSRDDSQPLDQPKETQASRAYLGEKMLYAYNPAKGIWEFDVNLVQQRQMVSHDDEDEEDEVGQGHDNSEEGSEEDSQDEEEDEDDDDSNAYDSAEEGPMTAGASPTRGDELAFRSNGSGKGGGKGGGGMSSSSSKKHYTTCNTAAGGGSAPGKSNKNNNNNNDRMKAVEEVDEHGLILAIHAAHFASQFSSSNNLQGMSYSASSAALQAAAAATTTGGSQQQPSPNGRSGGGGGLGDKKLSMSTYPTADNTAATTAGSTKKKQHQLTNGMHSSSQQNLRYLGNSLEMGGLLAASTTIADGSASSATPNSHGQQLQQLQQLQQEQQQQQSAAMPAQKISSSIFLVVMSIFFLSMTCSLLLTILLPVWFTAPLKSGGLGYGIRDLGLWYSTTGLLLLHVVIFGGARKAQLLLSASPVRALRIGCGLLFLALVLQLAFVRRYTMPLEDILHHTSGFHTLMNRHSSLGKYQQHAHDPVYDLVMSQPGAMNSEMEFMTIARNNGKEGKDSKGKDGGKGKDGKGGGKGGQEDGEKGHSRSSLDSSKGSGVSSSSVAGSVAGSAAASSAVESAAVGVPAAVVGRSSGSQRPPLPTYTSSTPATIPAIPPIAAAASDAVPAPTTTVTVDTAATKATTTVSSSSSPPAAATPMIPPTTVNTAHLVLYYLKHLLPTSSLFSLLITSFCTTCMICALYLLREASQNLFLLTLSSLFTTPQTIHQLITRIFGDILGPLFTCLFYALSYSLHLPYPMDSCFFLPITAGCCLMIYMLSLSLQVKFRGDYGVMSDVQEWNRSYLMTNSIVLAAASNGAIANQANMATTMSSKRNQDLRRGLSQRTNNNSKQTAASEGGGGAVSHGHAAASSNSLVLPAYCYYDQEHIFSIPCGDVHLLFTAMNTNNSHSHPSSSSSSYYNQLLSASIGSGGVGVDGDSNDATSYLGHTAAANPSMTTAAMQNIAVSAQSNGSRKNGSSSNNTNSSKNNKRNSYFKGDWKEV